VTRPAPVLATRPLRSDDTLIIARRPGGPRPFDAALFGGLDASVIADLIDQLPLVYFRAGQLVYAMGEPGDQLYLVVEGKVKIGSRGDDGRESLLEIVGPSEMFEALSV
jgi:CRP/FNR family cyclic AMP-dependent transcriptional regulator